jgi:hypothetical protein
MENFFAVPYKTESSSLSPTSLVIVNKSVVPIITQKPFFSAYTSPFTNLNAPTVITKFGVTPILPTGAYYYDSGIGENPLAIHEVNEDLRKKFLGKWLYEDYPEILRMLKVESGVVRILSKTEAEKNDISKDSEDTLDTKIDFIAHTILTLSKNRKILNAFVIKNNLKWYDLPHNERYVRKAQFKYVMRKLEEQQK